jgi:sensor histidine kinase YesM
VAGYFLGTLCADQWFGWSSWNSGSVQQLSASIIVTVLAGVAGSYFFYTKTQQGYLERRIAEARRQAMESRLKLLETQLEPHMLFNTLANLRALIATDPQRAQTMLDHMVDYLRATLSASRTSVHPLEQEFARLRDYLELLSVRMGARLRFTLELPEALRQHPVPPLLLQPLVENAIQHGLEPKVEGGVVTVRALHRDALLTLEVEDNGLGFDTRHTAEKPGHGFGLSQVRERLDATYGNAAAITFVAGHAGGTLASITIPFKP